VEDTLVSVEDTLVSVEDTLVGVEDTLAISSILCSWARSLRGCL